MSLTKHRITESMKENSPPKSFEDDVDAFEAKEELEGERRREIEKERRQLAAVAGPRMVAAVHEINRMFPCNKKEQPYDILSSLCDIVISHSFSKGTGEGSDYVGISKWEECRADMEAELLEWFKKQVVER